LDQRRHESTPCAGAGRPAGAGCWMSRKKACSRVGGPHQAVQHDPVRGREVPHQLGCRVDGELLVGMSIGVAGCVEGGGQPVRVRCADPGADAGLGAHGGQTRRPHQPPIDDDQHVVGGLLDLAQRMAGHQHRATLVRESAQVLAQPPHARRVEAVRRLVQDEHCRVAEHRRGQPQPLTHPEGELPDPPPRVRREPGLGQDAPGRVLGQPGRCREDAQVVQRGTAGVAARGLEDRADLTDRVWQLVVSPAANRRGPAAWRGEAEQHPQGGGLAGPVWPEHGRHLARSRDRAEVIDRENVPEGLGEAAQLDRTCHRRPSHRHDTASAAAQAI
jgi:hypothetical protein